MREGGCLCGTITWSVAGPFDTMLHCHCSMCRKEHGSLFVTFVSAPHDGFAWQSGEDAIVRYPSSEQGERPFCGTCGSPVPTVASGAGVAICLAGSLEGDLGITPQAHMFVGSKAPWHDILDDLPQHEGYPPEWGVGGVDRPVTPPTEGATRGSCLCGGVAFELLAVPRRVGSCHCSLCRKSRGAAHATNYFVLTEQLRWTRGEDLLRQFQLPLPSRFGTAFCGTCGSMMPRGLGAYPAWLVPAGVLDDDPGARPQGHIHVADKAPWFEILDDLPQYPQSSRPG